MPKKADPFIVSSKRDIPGPNILYKRARNIPQPTVNDPYTGLQKRQFEDNFNAHRTVKRAILVRSQFTLGRRYKLELEVFDKSLDDKEKQKLLEDKEYKRYLGYIKQLDEKLGMHNKFMAMLIQSAVFGRSALHAPFNGTHKFMDGEEYNGLPSFVHILNSQLLNKVFIDANTWEIDSVIYAQQGGMASGNEENNKIPIDELIYFTRSDYHITPRTIFYGRSDVEPIAHIAEMDRRMDEVDFKEISAQMWAGFLLAKVETRNQQVANAIIDQFQPGKNIAVPAGQVEVETMEVPKDLAGLIALRQSNELAILRGLSVPSIVMNFENITNRATADDVLLAWQKSTLEYERTWFKETVQPQWYDKLLEVFCGESIDTIPVRVKAKFDTITIADWADVANSALSLWNAGTIPMEKLYSLLGFEDEISQMRKKDPDMLKAFKEQNTQDPDQQEQQKNAALIDVAEMLKLKLNKE